jgi:hypothetical protein
MNLIISLLAVSSVFCRDIEEIRNSSATNVTLFNDFLGLDTPVMYSYSFFTSLELYKDGSSQSFLYGTLKLLDLSTYYFEGDQESLRMTVGWRNPMENAYDYTSVRVIYQKDQDNMVWLCDDGYGQGSTSTYYSDATTWKF